jgi:uncharacterized protein YuzE
MTATGSSITSTVRVEEGRMKAMKILEGRSPVTRTYDEEADVLYLSVGTPRPALGIDIGDGLVLRYDEAAREVGGVTLVGLQARLLRELSEQG